MNNRNNLTTINREDVYLLTYERQWEQLIELLRSNDKYAAITNDEVLVNFIERHFINELINKPIDNDETKHKEVLEIFCMLHESKQHNFILSDNNYRKIIIKIVENEPKVELSYRYASKFPEEEVCRNVIERYEEHLPKVFHHSQQEKFHVTENKNIQKIDARISLFKSKQEYQFYKAVREVFATYHVYPNVAISAIIDIDQIGNQLSQDERNYSFKALIDCVVVDAENEFKPFKFFELDSDFHDDITQQRKDKMKDRILSTAGQKLYRIRKVANYETETDFIKLIRDTLNE
jgi:hypothetical protein